MNFFSKTPSAKEQLRQNDKDLRKAGRDIERDRAHLEREEKKLQEDIKKAARSGDKALCTALAKNLVQLRRQKERSHNASSKIQSISSHGKNMAATAKLGEAMKTAGQSAAMMNALMNPGDVAKTMREFGMATTKLGMSEDIVNDALDDILNASEDEDEQDKIVQQVLDEIGIEVAGKMAKVPGAASHDLATEKALPSSDELEAQLARLRSS